MPISRRALIAACALLLAAPSVVGIVRFDSSAAGAAFHALVLLGGLYLGALALRRSA
jgi:hypothetical protein